MKKKILFVMPKFSFGGAEKSLLMLLNALVNTNKFDIELLLFKKEGAFCDHIPDKVKVCELSEEARCYYSTGKNIMKYDISIAKKIKHIVIRYFSTIYSKISSNNSNRSSQIRWQLFYRKWMPNNTKSYDYAVGYLDGETIYYVVDKVDAKIKYGWNQNDYSQLGYSAKDDLPYFKKLDLLITISDNCFRVIQKTFPSIIKKIRHIEPIVSREVVWSASKAYAVDCFKPDNFNIVSVGRLCQQKGFDFAIDAMKILELKDIACKWYIIGDGELKEKLQEKIDNYGLNNKVILLGQKKNPYPYILNADLFVQPSRFEGKSIILNETKLLERPIMLTNYLTSVDQIENEITGLIVEMTAKGIADGVIKLISDPKIREKFVNNLKCANKSNTTLSDNLKLFDMGEV